MSENMELWDSVSATDPKYTKHVGQRGGFTAIDAQYQIMRATEVFGPIGKGWGYIVGEPIFHENLIFTPVTLWHGDRSNTFGPIYSSAELKSGKGRVDNDAGKKATTDAITKMLSHLGISADVHLGKFDDNKYVAEMEKKFAPLISDEQHKAILEKAKQADRDIAVIVEKLDLKNLSDLEASEYDSVIKRLDKTIEENNRNQQKEAA